MKVLMNKFIFPIIKLVIKVFNFLHLTKIITWMFRGMIKILHNPIFITFLLIIGLLYSINNTFIKTLINNNILINFDNISHIIITNYRNIIFSVAAIINITLFVKLTNNDYWMNLHKKRETTYIVYSATEAILLPQYSHIILNSGIIAGIINLLIIMHYTSISTYRPLSDVKSFRAIRIPDDIVGKTIASNILLFYMAVFSFSNIELNRNIIVNIILILFCTGGFLLLIGGKGIGNAIVLRNIEDYENTTSNPLINISVLFNNYIKLTIDDIPDKNEYIKKLENIITKNKEDIDTEKCYNLVMDNILDDLRNAILPLHYNLDQINAFRHDSKNITMTMKYDTDMLLKNMENVSLKKLDEYAYKMSKGLDYLQDNINESKSVRKVPKPELLNVKNIIEESLERNRLNINAYIINYQNIPDEAVIYFDYNHAKICFQNIIKNSTRSMDIKRMEGMLSGTSNYTPAITFKYAVENNNALLSIIDNGKGMGDDIRRKIYKERVSDQIGESHGYGAKLIADLLKRNNYSIEVVKTNEDGTEQIICGPCNKQNMDGENGKDTGG